MSAQDNLLAPDVLHDPYAYFADLRETDPVHWNERWGGWLILRYDDVVKVFRDHDTSRAFPTITDARTLRAASPADH